MKLWLPPSVEAEQVKQCRCGQTFRLPKERAALVRHVTVCARRHGNEVQAEAELITEDPLSGPMDKEAWAWGRRRIAEGKPGFKRGRAA